METKQCSACGIEKDLLSFHRDSNRPDGRRSACKDCRSQKNARPERAVLPPVEPPPMDRGDLMKLARARAIKDTVESNFPEFQRRYADHLRKLELQRVWHSLN